MNGVPRRVWARAAGALGLFALAVAARATAWPVMLMRPGLIPAAADEYYHLRRIHWAVERFPELIAFDRYLNFPHGAPVVWPPLFDWSLAALSRALGATTPQAIERVVIWVPPLLGGATVLLVVWLAARFLGAAFGAAAGERAGWVAGVVLALLPAHHSYTNLGRVDHHAAVSFATTALLGAGLAFLSRAPGERGRWLRAGLVGLALGGVLLVWPGALLHVGILEAALVASLLAASGAAAARARAAELAVAHAVAFVLVLPFCWGNEWPEFGNASPLVLSAFQPAWFGAAALAFGAVALGWGTAPLGATRGRRIAFAAAVGAAGVALGFAWVPGLADALGYASGWFAKAEDFQTHVTELRSLLFPYGRFEPAVASRYLSPLFFALPLALAWLGWQAWRRGDPGLGLVVAWGAGCAAAAAAQFRFINSLAVAFALVVGICAAAAWAALRGRPERRAAWAAALMAGGIALAWPLPAHYGRALPDWERWARGQAPALPDNAERQAAVLDVAGWLSEHSPETSGYLDPDAAPEYAVLSTWGDGHLLRYAARRPMVQDNFGVYGGRSNFEAAEAYFAATDEDEALAILDRLGVRYVVATPNGSGHGAGYAPDTLARRLAIQRGSFARVRTPARGPLELPALTRHRLVYERPATWLADRDLNDDTLRASSYKLYERVPGARVEGRARAGDLVQIRLDVTTAAGAAHTWASRARADDAGRYAFTVPYPTGATAAAGVATESAYRVASPRASAELAVPPAAVAGGETIAGPDLRGPETESP